MPPTYSPTSAAVLDEPATSRFGKARKRFNPDFPRHDHSPVESAGDDAAPEPIGSVAVSPAPPSAPAHALGVSPVTPRERDTVHLKPLLTTGEAARVCGLSQQTVIRCFDRGLLQGFRVPGSLSRRIPREALIEFMQRNKIPTDHIQGRRPRVLIVDQDLHTAEGLVAALRMGNLVDVQAATCAYDAGALTERFAPDLVVIDPSLPDAGGGTVLQRLRATPTMAGVRLILLCDPRFRAKYSSLMNRDVHAVFTKPISVLRVKEHVMRLLELAPHRSAPQPVSA